MSAQNNVLRDWRAMFRGTLTLAKVAEALSTEPPSNLKLDDYYAVVEQVHKHLSRGENLSKEFTVVYANFLMKCEVASHRDAVVISTVNTNVDSRVSFADTYIDPSSTNRTTTPLFRKHQYCCHCSPMKLKFSDAGNREKLFLRKGEKVYAKKDPTLHLTSKRGSLSSSAQFNWYIAHILKLNKDGTYKLVFQVDLSQRSRVPREQIMKITSNQRLTGCCQIQ